MNEAKPTVDMTTVDGNIFSVFAAASKVLTRAGLREQADEMKRRLPECGSYDEALQLAMEYVEFE
jgi:hypothetical protein